VWNWQAEEELQRCATTLEGNLGDVYAARWHPMGVSLRASEGEEDGEGRADLVPLQNHIATGGYDKIVRLFDVESGTILKTFTGEFRG
jgi:COMPASS component SWD3